MSRSREKETGPVCYWSRWSLPKLSTWGNWVEDHKKVNRVAQEDSRDASTTEMPCESVLSCRIELTIAIIDHWMFTSKKFWAFLTSPYLSGSTKEGKESQYYCDGGDSNASFNPKQRGSRINIWLEALTALPGVEIRNEKGSNEALGMMKTTKLSPLWRGNLNIVISRRRK